jgi:Dolichyl-phosphate-mannose-protein mannosyltransferase
VTAVRMRPTLAGTLPARPQAGNTAFVALIIGILTTILRLGLDFHGFDLFGDEVIYTNIGRSVISGGFPNFEGQTFFLHGPVFFYLEAGWARLVGNPPGLMAWVYEMRALNALLAGATAVILVLLAARASSLCVGVVTGLLFALDPFCIRQNDRVLLETALMLWVMLGYLVFASLIERPPSRHDWLRAVGAGLLFGCAVLTKDEGAILTVLPLLTAAALRWGPRRAMTLLTVGTIVVVYAAYVAVVVANGQFSGLWAAKTSGVQRMLGLVETSGFHSSGGGSLSARLLAEAGYFVMTYVILALALPAFVVMMRRGGQLPRILGLVYCAAGVALGYALVLGTLEEQELYLLIVPSLLTIPLAASLLRGSSLRSSRSARWERRRKPRAALITAALALALTVNLAVYGQWLRQPDDAIVQLLNYIRVNVAPGTAIADPTATLDANGDVVDYALGRSYNMGPWVTPAIQQREHARYLLVLWGLIGKGYGTAALAELRHLVGHDQQVFSAWGRSNGQVTLYKLPLPRAPARTRQ